MPPVTLTRWDQLQSPLTTRLVCFTSQKQCDEHLPMICKFCLAGACQLVTRLDVVFAGLTSDAAMTGCYAIFLVQLTLAEMLGGPVDHERSILASGILYALYLQGSWAIVARAPVPPMQKHVNCRGCSITTFSCSLTAFSALHKFYLGSESTASFHGITKEYPDDSLSASLHSSSMEVSV